MTTCVLGAGFMGARHAQVWARLTGVRAVYSRTLGHAEQVAGRVGAKATTRLDEALDGCTVADVCLPTHLHRAACEAALAAGCDVLVEKPVALTLADADAIEQAARTAGRLCMVAHALRYWPEYVELARLVTSGALGTPRTVTTTRLSYPPAWSSWLADPARSGGLVVDLLVHDFDVCNWLLGPPASVDAFGGAGHVWSHVRAAGAQALLEGSWEMPPTRPFSSSIRVVGDDGAAEYAFTSAPAEEGNLSLDAPPVPLMVYRDDVEQILCEPADPYEAEIEDFLRCVRNRAEPERVTFADARAALDLALSAAASLSSR